jgi:ribosomal protein S19E (S16A)
MIDFVLAFASIGLEIDLMRKINNGVNEEMYLRLPKNIDSETYKRILKLSLLHDMEKEGFIKKVDYRIVLTNKGKKILEDNKIIKGKK